MTDTDAMNVTVTTHLPNSIDEQETHRFVEGIPLNKGTDYNIPDAINVKQRHHGTIGHDPWSSQWRDDYLYPEISVTDTTGKEHVFDHALINLDEVEPKVDVWMIHDETASREHAEITQYNAYGIQSETYTDSFDNEQTTYSVYIQKNTGDNVVFSPSSYRGFIVKYPTGGIRVIGDIERHSKTVQKHDDTAPVAHPYGTDTGYMTITADERTYNEVVNVFRPEPREYVLLTAPGNEIDVSEITAVDGPTYTATIRHASQFEFGMVTSSFQRVIGMYIEENPQYSSTGGPELVVVGHPDSAAVYKTPITYRVASLSDIEFGFVKQPDGTITRSFEDLPQFTRNE